PEGVEMVMPGDNVQMTIELIAPIAMEKELRFAIREGGRTVGAGVVTEILQKGRTGEPFGLPGRRPATRRRPGAVTRGSGSSAEAISGDDAASVDDHKG